MVINHFGPIAQLDRASVFETEGWAFESLWDRHPSLYNYFSNNLLILGDRK